MRTTIQAITILAVVWAAHNPANACIPIPNASGFADMESRRAVIWIKETTFEIMFQNRYSGDAKDFAWVIPLPGVPTEVAQPSEMFLTDLDKYTSPMFEDRQCVIPCFRGYDAGAVPGGPSDGTLPPDVTVWDSGKLGDLDYVVLSATAVAELKSWLDPRGYSLPTELEPLVQDYLDKGFAFFAAKLAADAQQPASVPVVKFVFDRTQTELVYPLRISAYNRQTPLDTLIWVIGADTYVPKHYPSEAMPEVEQTEPTYEQALTQVMSKAAGTTFAIQYADQPGVTADYYDDPSFKRAQLYYMYGSSDQSELKQIFDDKLRVVRLRASLNPKGTNSDLELEKTPTQLQVSGWYVAPCPGGVKHEPCTDSDVPKEAGAPEPDAGPSNDTGIVNNGTTGEEDDGGCQLAQAGSLPTLTLLGLAGLILLGRRRRR